MYYKDDKIETENQDHGKEEKASMSVLKANSVAVIEHQIGSAFLVAIIMVTRLCPHLTLTEVSSPSHKKLHST